MAQRAREKRPLKVDRKKRLELPREGRPAPRAYWCKALKPQAV